MALPPSARHLRAVANDWTKFLQSFVSEWGPENIWVFPDVRPDCYITPLLRPYHAFITPGALFKKNIAGVISLQIGEVMKSYMHETSKVNGLMDCC